MALGSASSKHSPRISLIATFYNAEDYLDRCVCSLANQTHDDYEVVLVDDGSNDNTWGQLREYADGDKVRCFTKSNGGPGDARNFGVDKACGQYVSFVDGDDFVSPYYLEGMDLALIEFGCECAIGTHKVVSEAQASDVDWQADYDVSFVKKDEAIEMLAYEELTESPWARLVPRASYCRIPFPDRYYEDVAVAGKRFLELGDVAVQHVQNYAYVMRKGSVVHRNVATVKQLDDFVWAIDEFLTPLEEAYPQFASAFSFRRALECARAHALAARVCDDRKTAEAVDARLIETIRESLANVRADGRVSRPQKARFELLARCPGVYDLLFGAYERLFKTGATGVA